MKKKVAITALAVLLAALVVIFAFSGNEEEAAPETEPVAATEEITVPATEETVPGLEDSIFDEETEASTEATEETETTEATEETAPPKQDNTNPTEPKPTKPRETEPAETEPSETEPTETEPAETEPTVPSAEEMDYETFQKLSPAEQQAFVESFDSIEEFFDWYNAAKEAYEKANAPIEVGGGAIDIGALVDGEE